MNTFELLYVTVTDYFLDQFPGRIGMSTWGNPIFLELVGSAIPIVLASVAHFLANWNGYVCGATMRHEITCKLYLVKYSGPAYDFLCSFMSVGAAV